MGCGNLTKIEMNDVIFFQPTRRKSRAMSIMTARNKEEKMDEDNFDEEGGGGESRI